MRNNLLMLTLTALSIPVGYLRPAESASVKKPGCSSCPRARSLVNETADVKFNKTAFSPRSSTNASPRLFMGASAQPGADKDAYSLASAALSTSGPAVVVTALAPTTVTLNGADNQPNPINNATVTGLKLLNQTQPVVARQTDPQNELFLVTDPAAGKTVLASDPQINDANTASTKIIPAIAASTNTIFAAVSATDQPWEGTAGNLDAADNRGIAVLKPAADAKSLEVFDATNFGTKGAGNKAVQLDSKPTSNGGSSPFAFSAVSPLFNGIKRAQFGPEVDMYWDQGLERLYLGLTNARRDNPDSQGGVLSVVTGRIDTSGDGSLKVGPIVNNANIFQFYNPAKPAGANTNKLMVGFYYDGNTPAGGNSLNNGNDDVRATAKQIRMMHTTTGKDYLIVDSSVGLLNKAPINIVALPLLGKFAADGKTAIAQDQIGTVSKVVGGVPTFNEPPAAFTDMLTTDNVQAIVAPGLLDPDNIADIFVEGDAVYMVMNGLTKLSNGIFQSTALFDGTGAIQAWTPAQRVMGNVEHTYGAGLDNTTGNYYMLTSKSNDPNNVADFANINTAKITKWGTSDSVVSNIANSKRLSNVLEALFPQNIGGVFQVFTFDERTPGFVNGGNDHSQFAAMVAVGLNKIALIQSGSDQEPQFAPTTQFVNGTNVFPLDLSTLQFGSKTGIGPVTSAEFSRMTAPDTGWLFVGGVNGVAVLRQDDGKGFASQNGLAGLSPAGYPVAGYSFKALTPTTAGNSFANTRKLVALNNRLYIMTQSTLYVVTPSVGKFQDAGAIDLTEIPIVQTGNPLTPGLTADACLNDFIVISGQSEVNGFRALLATTKGLFQITNTGGNNVVTEIEINGEPGLPVLQLEYLTTTKGVPGPIGNVYVLVGNTSTTPSTGMVFRFAVNGNFFTPVGSFVQPVPMPNNQNGLLLDLEEFRQFIFADGSLLLNTRSESFGDSNLVNLTPFAALNATYPITQLLGINTNVNSEVGAPIRDSASGTLIIPGDWGVRVNE